MNIENINYEDLLKFSKEFLNTIRFEWLFIGNINE